MLYVAIDQHAKQITVCVRNEEGETVLRRQVSTRPEKITAFFGQLTEMDAEFLAILEVCGFNDWLIEELRKWKCREIVLIHPEKPSKKKTNRRDAQKLADLLWLNRQRLAAGQIVRGLRRVHMVSQEEREDRQLTSLRKNLGQRRVSTLNKIHRIVNRHNLIWNYPTKTFQTQAGRRWLAKAQLPPIDRALSAASQPGQLFRTDARLPQFRRRAGPVGLNHQAREQDRPLHLGAAGPPRAEARPEDARLVSQDQAAPRLEDC